MKAKIRTQYTVYIDQEVETGSDSLAELSSDPGAINYLFVKAFQQGDAALHNAIEEIDVHWEDAFILDREMLK